ncbi:MAG: hypothetical protein J7L38_00100 [Thermoproteales archaeon]|nr:hypothetical protein [Thermoproteales archaeon]RLE66615.1 MAG: hypothetical protein DRJ47_02020 [Thermoprotei archaeon]
MSKKLDPITQDIMKIIEEYFKDRKDLGELAKKIYLIYLEKGRRGLEDYIKEVMENVEQDIEGRT